jgi:RND superfamily putative drug exporter
MVCVFGSFILGDLRAIKLIGLGLAAAVLVDATIVRMILVPATMELLGRRNWWMPRWLDRVVPHLAIERGATDVPGPSSDITGSGPDDDREPVAVGAR